jgi:hypothetical protein
VPRKLRYSLTALTAMALVAASASSSAQAQAKKTNMRPWTTTHDSNRSIGRNDGYVQQIPSNKATKGLATKGKGSQAPGVDTRQLMRQNQN